MNFHPRTVLTSLSLAESSDMFVGSMMMRPPALCSTMSLNLSMVTSLSLATTQRLVRTLLSMGRASRLTMAFLHPEERN